MNKLNRLSVFLIVVAVAFSYIATAYQSFVPKVRTVELQEEAVDYNNYISEYYDAELEYKKDSNELIFTGTRDLPASIFGEIDLVNNEELANDIPITYTFDYLADTNEFYLSIIANIDGGEIIDKWYGVPFTTEDGKTDIVFNTGDGLVCLSELEESGLINNCGWFSRLCRKIAKVAVVVAVAAVVAAVVVTAPAVVAAAPALVAAAPAALATTAGTIVTGAAATGALASAASVGATLIGVGVAAATVAAGAYVAGQVGTMTQTQTKVVPKTKILTTTMEATVSQISINTRVYQFAYLFNGVLIKTSHRMNYLEAYGVLIGCGLINTSSLGNLLSAVTNLTLPEELETLINDIKNKMNKGEVKKDYFGIYTTNELDAAKLAYAAGGFYKGIAQSETHNVNIGSGYYYHFHDYSHNIHVWYGTAI